MPIQPTVRPAFMVKRKALNWITFKRHKIRLLGYVSRETLDDVI